MLGLGDDVVLDNYMHFIALILRVRQASCHASLIPPEVKERAEEVLKYVTERTKNEMDVFEAEELLQRLRGVLEDSEQLEECAVCFESIDEESAVVLRSCKHVSHFAARQL